MKNIAILAPGLLGGSLALALRARGEQTISVWARRQEAVEEVQRQGSAHFASTDLGAVVRRAELVILCTPIGSMAGLARELAGLVTPATLVTDVGSVKASIVAELGGILGGRFVGSHPMAGSERAGLEAARADLFAGAVCIVTPDAASEPGAVAAVSAFWEKLGCRVRQLAPAEHDEVVALVSHLPHLLAATLVETAAGAHPAALDFCGPGFRDTTRVASGPPAMWAEILHANRDAVRKSAEAMIENLRRAVTLLDSAPADPAMLDFLTHAKAARDRLRPPS